MNQKKSIALSASVAAAVVPAAGQAADLRNAPASPVPPAAENPFFVSVEGGAVFSSFAKGSDAANFTQQKLGQSTGKSMGPYGSISIGRKIEATNYDWRISASATQLIDNKTSGTYGPYLAGSSNSASFQAADVDVGRTFKTDLFEARVFAGVRGINANSKSGATSSYLGYYGYGISSSSRFLGVGPRVGADMRVGNEIGLAASVAAAALYGQQTSKVSVNENYLGTRLGGDVMTETKYDWVTDVSASLAASWRPSKSTEVAAGYRAEKLFNLNMPQNKDLTVHGPFVKVGVKF